MTQRENAIECLQGMETLLIDLGIYDQISLRSAVIALARTNRFVLTWIIKHIDDERREKNGRSN